MRTFLARATIKFDVIASFELTDEEYTRAITKYGDLDAYAANELHGEAYNADPVEQKSSFNFRSVTETTLINKD